MKHDPTRALKRDNVLAAALLASALLPVLAGTASASTSAIPGLPDYVQYVKFGSTTSNCDSCVPHVCADRPVHVVIRTGFGDGCWSVRGARLLPILSSIGTPVVQLEVRHACAGVCSLNAPIFDTAIDLPASAPGPQSFRLMIVQNQCPDTSFSFVGEAEIPFVADRCDTDRCVFPFLGGISPVVDPRPGCALVLPPGGRGTLPLSVQTNGVALAGLQGTVEATPNVHVLHLDARPIGNTPMHLVTKRQPNGSIQYVMYADAGAPIPANALTTVLWATLEADTSVRHTPGAVGGVSATVTAASDAGGNSVPVCPIDLIRVPDIPICFALPADCDANRDGYTNVADLVRMVFCYLNPAACPDSAASRPDCNGDGTYTLADLMCCAWTMVGGGARDSSQAPGPLEVHVGASTSVDGIVSTPIQFQGTEWMGGAMLRIRYPADRYTVGPFARPAQASAATPAFGSPLPLWTPLQDESQGEVILALVRSDDAAPSRYEYALEFARKDGAAPGGEVEIVESSFFGTDGKPIRLDLAGTKFALPLDDGAGGSVSRIDLAFAPNPASATSRFVVRLPQAGNVDLGVFDLAGRRLATPFKGAMAAGERTIAWDAKQVHAGVYFARLTVDGVVRTTRVTVLPAR